MNYRLYPIVLVELIKGNEDIRQEAIVNFVGRMDKSWQVAQKRLHQAIQQQAKWYDAHHRPTLCRERDLVLLSTKNLYVKGAPMKLKCKFLGLFYITKCIGSQSCKLHLPTT